METGGYRRAKDLLKEKFGDRYAISSSRIGRITSVPRVTSDTLEGFADDLLGFRETMHALECLSEITQQVLVKFAEKLPTYLQHRWKRLASKLSEGGVRPGSDDLVSFTQSAAKELNNPVYGSLGSSTIKQADHTTQKRGSQFHGVTTATVPRCPACRFTGCSSLFLCEKFKVMVPSERYGLAKNDRRCFNCLKKGHSAGECRVEQTCMAKGCTLKHTKFLYTARDQSRKEATGSSKDGGAAKPESGNSISSSVNVC